LTVGCEASARSDRMAAWPTLGEAGTTVICIVRMAFRDVVLEVVLLLLMLELDLGV
jgi:hypothetical protein